MSFERSARISLASAAWLLLGLLLPVQALAQPAQPLRKGDVVRLLTGGAYSQAEIAAIVNRSCLTFRPTDRDLNNFRTLGAEAEVMGEIRRCALGQAAASGAPSENRTGEPGAPERTVEEASQGGTVAAGEPTPSDKPAGGGAAPGVDFTLFLSPRRATAAPGETVGLVVEITVGADPARGVPLELREQTAGGEGETLAGATTDAEGRAMFFVPATDLSGVRRFSVNSLGVPLQGDNVMEVETVAEPIAAEPVTGREGDVSGGRSGAAEPSGAGGVAQPPVPARNWRTVEEGLREAERLSVGGRYGDAGAIYTALLQERLDDVDVLVAYGYHLARMGDAEEAEGVLQRAFGLAPRRIDVRQALGRLSLWRGNPEEAVRWFQSATEVQPNDPETWRGLGEALIEAGRREEARKAYRRARKLEQGGN